MTPDGIDQQLQHLADQQTKMLVALERLATLQESEAARCPYRVDIAKNSEMVPRVHELEKAVIRIDLQIAKVAVIVGLIEGVVFWLLQMGLGKLIP